MNAADAMFFEAKARDKANPILSDAVGAKPDGLGRPISSL